MEIVETNETIARTHDKNWYLFVDPKIPWR
jgi:hypothetical protein